jgi:hypothetical protein
VPWELLMKMHYNEPQYKFRIIVDVKRGNPKRS